MLAALIAAGTLPAFTASAKVDLDGLPEPISSEQSAVKAFRKQKPELKVTGNYYSGYYYGNTLEWTKVGGALYYELYVRAADEEGVYEKWRLCSETFDNSCNYDVFGTYQFRVRAVTFSYDDKIQYGSFSDTVTVKPKMYDPSQEDSEYPYNEYNGIVAYAPLEEEVTEEAAEAVIAEDDYAEEDFDDEDFDDEDYAVPEFAAENTEEYGHYEENGYKDPAISPLSTFSADVDTASYTNIRRLINDGDRVPADAVRIEEMINYFDYGYKKPSKSAFAIDTELSDCPWNKSAQILKIGIQGKDLKETPNSNLVFLVDTSGSMGWSSEEKIELVKKSINILSENLTENDRISIVTYSGSERVLLAGAKGDQVNTVSKLTSLMDTNGSTNGEGGILAAYDVAGKYFIEGGNNRIIMMTDGDLNVGISDEDELKKLIEEKRESGVYFSVLGFGKDNIKDNKMETLADNGNGSYHYIDTAQEAYKVLAEERNSTIFTIAKDVKIQAEFNPANVKSYRLIGYDNRRLENEDFYNSAKDAGDVGAGQSVTVLYEVIPAKGGSDRSLKYQTTSEEAYSDELVTVKLRYKDPESGESRQITKAVNSSLYSRDMTDGMKLSCAAAEFGMVLKESRYKGSSTAKGACSLAQSIKDPDNYTKEFIELMKEYIGEE